MAHTYAGNTIAIVSSTNATPIVVTATAHGRANGDVVLIAGHLVNTSANGEWVVAGSTANAFQLTGSVGNGVGGATGTVSAFAPTASLPDDITDPRNAASVNSPFQTLADRCMMLYRDFKQRLLGIFPIVPTLSVTRGVTSTPESLPTQWAPNSTGLYWVQLVATTGQLLIVPVRLPHGAIWTGISVLVQGANASVPAAPILVKGQRMVLATGANNNVASLPSTADPAPGVTAHAIAIAGGTEVIDNSVNKYMITITGESGAGSNAGDLYICATVTYSLTAVDAAGQP